MDEAERCNRIGLMYAGRLLLVNTPAELKQRMTGVVAEISCAQTHIASEPLKSQDNVESVQAFSDRLRVLLRDDGDIRKIASFLESKGVSVADIRRATPNLEDVFISLLRKSV